MRRARGPRVHERGSAVIETAIAIPALLAVTMALMWLVGLAMTHARVDEAAFAAARLAARGGTDDAVRAQVEQRLSGASVIISGTPEAVSVTVTKQALADVPILRGIDYPVAVTAAVAREAS